MRKRDDSHSKIGSAEGARLRVPEQDCHRPLDEHQAICAQAAKLPKASHLLGFCHGQNFRSTGTQCAIASCA